MLGDAERAMIENLGLREFTKKLRSCTKACTLLLSINECQRDSGVWKGLQLTVHKVDTVM